MAADLSTVVGQWVGQYPSDEIVNGKPLWDQPGIEEVMRAAMGKYFLRRCKKACALRKRRWQPMASASSSRGPVAMGTIAAAII